MASRCALSAASAPGRASEQMAHRGVRYSSASLLRTQMHKLLKRLIEHIVWNIWILHHNGLLFAYLLAIDLRQITLRCRQKVI